jgi:hypothetical protein
LGTNTATIITFSSTNFTSTNVKAALDELRTKCL